MPTIRDSQASPPGIEKRKGLVVWFTGLSGSGKSTLANGLEEYLSDKGVMCFLLDGDILRQGLCSNLGYSLEDRKENIRRVSEVSRLFAMSGVVAIVALISPLRADRERARALFKDGEFIEVFVDAPLAVCEKRDVKGLYARARAGGIPDFTGISSPYEPPLNAEVHVETGLHSYESSLELVTARVMAALQAPTSA